MSVREQIYVRTDLPVVEIARSVAEMIGGQTDHREGHSWLVVETDRLIPGASGEFGGPVIPHSSEAEFRPENEYEAPDSYNIEIRLWQTNGHRVNPDTGRDIEAAAASALFTTLSESMSAPMIHVRQDDKLISAALPGRGIYHFPKDTSIYDWDEGRWNGFILTDAAGSNHK